MIVSIRPRINSRASADAQSISNEACSYCSVVRQNFAQQGRRCNESSVSEVAAKPPPLLSESSSKTALLSEEYDPNFRRMIGSFPKAFSHLGLLSTVLLLEHSQPDWTPCP